MGFGWTEALYGIRNHVPEKSSAEGRQHGSFFLTQWFLPRLLTYVKALGSSLGVNTDEHECVNLI
jgi:hypothetical protein